MPDVHDHRFRYSAYGLALACDAPLEAPGLLEGGRGAAAEEADVLVDWMGAVTDGRDEAEATACPTPPGWRVIVEPTGGWLAVSAPAPGDGQWVRLRFGYGRHHVQFDVAPGGARVVVTWTPAVLPAYAGTLLLSTVMRYLLYSRGRLALHASVVAWRESAYVFAGAQGAGKSTTIAALIQRGCAGVSDDIAALTRQPSGWAVFGGLRGIRLAPEAHAALALPAEAAAPVWTRALAMPDVDYDRLEDKALITVGEPPPSGDGDGTLPLAGVFLLPPRSDESAAPRITALPGASVVPRLAEHLLVPAWLEPTVDQSGFMTLVDLARSTPVYSVERPDTLAALPRLGDALLEEMERLRR